MKTVTFAKGGTAERTVPIEEIRIPDLWHIAKAQENPDDAEKVRQVWHMAHDLLKAIRLDEATTKQYFMVYRSAVDEDGHDVDSFFAICETEDKAQAKIDDLTKDFGPMGFAYRPVVLE